MVPTEALKLCEDEFGPDHPIISGFLDDLARFNNLAKGNCADAAPLYRRSLAIREKFFGPEHPQVATSLNNLAELFWRVSDVPDTPSSVG